MFIIRPKALANVVFPQPTGPTNATISPGFILKEISLSIFLGESSYFIVRFLASNLPKIGLDILTVLSLSLIVGSCFKRKIELDWSARRL